MINKKVAMIALLIVTLLALILLFIFKEGHQLPEQMLVPLPMVSQDEKTEWRFEENKTTGAYDNVVVYVNGEKHRYRIGEELRILNSTYVLRDIANYSGLGVVAELERK